MSAFMFEQAAIKEELFEERKMCKSAENQVNTPQEKLYYAN